MRSFKKYILIFLSVTVFSFLHFSSIGKSNNNISAYTFQKFSNCEFACNYFPFSKISTALPVNTDVRNRRSVKEDDHKFLFDTFNQNKIYFKKSFNFIIPFAEQRLYCFCTGLIPSRAPPALN